MDDKTEDQRSNLFSPARSGSGGWVSSYKAKGHLFDSRSEHVAGLQIQSQGRAHAGSGGGGNWSMFLSLSSPLSNKYIHTYIHNSKKIKEVTCSSLQGQGLGLEPKPSSFNESHSTVDDVNFHKNTSLYYLDIILLWHFWKTIDKGNSEIFAENSWRIMRHLRSIYIWCSCSN